MRGRKEGEGVVDVHTSRGEGASNIRMKGWLAGRRCAGNVRGTGSGQAHEVDGDEKNANDPKDGSVCLLRIGLRSRGSLARVT